MKKDKPAIDLSLLSYSKFNSRDIGSQFFKILFEKAIEIAPDKMDIGNKWVRIGPKNLSYLLDFWENKNSMLLNREGEIESTIAIVLRDEMTAPRNILWWIEEMYFEEESHRQDFLQTSISIYDLLQPDYGSIHQTEDHNRQSTVQDPRYGKTTLPVNLEKGLPGVYWANFFGKKYVERFGRSVLLKTPCEKIIELSDGGLLLLTSQSPLNPSSEENRRAQMKLRQYLGEENFYPQRSDDFQ